MQGDVIDVCADGRPRKRKIYSLAFKRRVVALSLEPGVSVSQVAQQHRINTNLLFTWRRDPGNRAAAAAAPVALLPVTIGAPQHAPDAPQRNAQPAYIELQIGEACLRLHGAVDLPTVSAVVRLLERRR